MITKGRMAAVTIVSLGLGFVGGVRFVGSDLGLRLVSPPRFPASAAGAGPTAPTANTKPAAPSKQAVKDPWPVKFRGGETGLMPEVERSDLLPAPGCTWIITPRPFQPSQPWVTTTPDRALFGNAELGGPDHAFRSNLVQYVKQAAARLDLRPVYFEEDGTRHIPYNMGRGSGGSSSQDRDIRCFYAYQSFGFRPFDLPSQDKLVYFGIEQYPPNADQLLAEAAHKAAKDQGMVILPIPQTGQPYNFDLTTADGKRLRPEDFRGKEVVIVVWGPTTTNDNLMRVLRDLRKANNQQGFDLIGVSFAESVESARETFGGPEIADNLIVVPNDPKIRRLWREGAQIQWIPTCFFIDKKGVLQAAGALSQVQSKLYERNGLTAWGTPKPKPPGQPVKQAPQGRPAGALPGVSRKK